MPRWRANVSSPSEATRGTVGLRRGIVVNPPRSLEAIAVAMCRSVVGLPVFYNPVVSIRPIKSAAVLMLKRCFRRRKRQPTQTALPFLPLQHRQDSELIFQFTGLAHLVADLPTPTVYMNSDRIALNILWLWKGVVAQCLLLAPILLKTPWMRHPLSV